MILPGKNHRPKLNRKRSGETSDFAQTTYGWELVPHLFGSPCYYVSYGTSAANALELEEYLDQEICRTAPLSEAPEDSGAIDSSTRTAAA